MSSPTPTPTPWPIPEESAEGVSRAALLDAIENLTALVELIAERLGLDLDDLYST